MFLDCKSFVVCSSNKPLRTSQVSRIWFLDQAYYMIDVQITSSLRCFIFYKIKSGLKRNNLNFLKEHKNVRKDVCICIRVPHKRP